VDIQELERSFDRRQGSYDSHICNARSWKSNSIAVIISYY